MNAILGIYDNSKAKKTKAALTLGSSKRLDGSVTVLGPYKSRDKWRLVVKSPKGRKALVFDTAADAETAKSRLMASAVEIESLTVGKLIAKYTAYRASLGAAESSVKQISRFCGLLVPDFDHGAEFSDTTASNLYTKATERYAVATHRAGLRKLKAVYTYGLRCKLVSSNPWANIEPIGLAKTGKDQLRSDEARKLVNHLISVADSDWSALPVLIAMFLGLRVSEVLKIKKRDIDCDGTVLHVSGTKTKNAKRRLSIVSPTLRTMLLKHVSALSADDLLFVTDQGSPRSRSGLWSALARHCRDVGVRVVCLHSLRGLNATLAVCNGAASSAVASALGHGSDAVTRKHYIAPEAMETVGECDLGRMLGADTQALRTSLLALPTHDLHSLLASLGFGPLCSPVSFPSRSTVADTLQINLHQTVADLSRSSLTCYGAWGMTGR